MQVFALWHGGNGWAHPYPDDAETFPSLKAAMDAFWRRADHDPYYPCVTEETPENGGPEMWLAFAPFGADAYPDRIIRFGPRGGIVVERT